MWYKSAIGYQIYPKSFKSIDSSVGTIKGITSKLDYLKDLGVDLIWICPIFDSPMDDNGYDIRDYYKINHDYGTMEDVKEMITKAHKLGLKIIFDLVLNHTSIEHEWFKKSCAKDPYYDDFYIWSKEKYNWGSFFGGSAFSYNEERKEYFLHIFSNKMPDLNWKSVNLKKEVKKIMEYYLALGIDGFRLDAISHLCKKKLENTTPLDKDLVYDYSLFSNLKEVHNILKEFRREIFSHYNIMTIGEIGGDPTIKQALDYCNDELDMVYTFGFTNCAKKDSHNMSSNKMDVKAMRNLISAYQNELNEKGWMGLYLTNHDIERAMSLYGDMYYFIESGSMLAVLMYMLKGTPFIYNGEEIGMTNYPFKKVSDFDDVRIRTTYKLNTTLSEEEFVNAVKDTSRDNARTIMQWNDSEYAGFSSSKPWFHINPNYKTINVKKEEQEERSLLNEYKKIIKLRKSLTQITQSDYEEIMLDERIISYKRGNLLIICNCTNNVITLNNLPNVKRVLYNNYNNSHDYKVIEPYQAYVMEVE